METHRKPLPIEPVRVILVRCPECHRCASVKPRYEASSYVFSVLYCADCGLHATSDTAWYGGKRCVDGNCINPDCSMWFYLDEPITTSVTHLLRVCPKCGTQNNFKVEPKRRHFHDHGSTHERNFGLPFWLQTSVKSHTLWAFNEEHIRWLREYIASSKRENYDLPRFMILAKNRKQILKGLDRLEALLNKA